MKTFALPSLILLATAAFTACPPQPGPGPFPPAPVADATVDGAPVVDAAPIVPDVATLDGASTTDAGPSTLACRNACAALAAANCPHGDLLVCAASLTLILSDGKIGNPQTGRSMTCTEIAAVRTVIDAMALGFKCK